MEIESNEHLLKLHFIPQVFSPEECREIVALQGYTGPSLVTDNAISNHRIRHSTSTFVPADEQNKWIADRLIAKLTEVNDTYYHFRITQLSPLQIIGYGENGFYDWHVDIGGKEFSSRKLSLVTFLSDEADYEGGQLKIIAGANARAVPDQQQGTAVFFPSYLLHKVEPVRKGQRYSLVMWAHGPCFQ
jgi:PKHD-type hydroxylase